MATMKDVARLAGVSLGTVSNVLNGKASVLPENQEKVFRAMEELHFKYNMTASALRTKRTKSIGLIVPTIVNPFFQELTLAVEEHAYQEGFTVSLCDSYRIREREQQYMESLLGRGVDGLILVDTKLTGEELARLRERIPVVLVDYTQPLECEICVVNVDDGGGITQGMAYLTECGHREIAFVGGSTYASSNARRTAAYESFLKEHGMACRPEYVCAGDYSWLSGQKAAECLLTLERRPTAVFCSSDMMAIGLMRRAREMGVTVGQELSVMGYDNIEMSGLYTPALTTVDYPRYEVGKRAETLLVKEINGENIQEKRTVFATRIIQRESVAVKQ